MRRARDALEMHSPLLRCAGCERRAVWPGGQHLDEGRHDGTPRRPPHQERHPLGQLLAAQVRCSCTLGGVRGCLRAVRQHGIVALAWLSAALLLACRDLRTPFGGVKDSGLGREGGKFSLDFYSEWKNVCVFMGAP